MYKTVFLTLFFSATLIAIKEQPIFSQVLTNNIPYPTTPVAFEANPVCMMQMENGTIINLSNICGKASISDNYTKAELAEYRANRARATQQLNAVCKSPDLNADMRQLCKNGFPNY